MYRKMVFKRIFLPASSSTLLVASVVAASKESKSDDEKKSLIRPKELPIYAKPSEKSDTEGSEPEKESQLMSVVRQAREGLMSVSDQLNQVSDKVNHIVETGKAHMSSSIQILRDEDNYPQRFGAIAVGGLVGYLVAIRRGWFRRLVYTGTGATAVAAICYPEETREYSAEGFRLTKRYVVIAYHFVNGVLRDYVGVQLPNLPGPLSIGSASAAEKDASTVPTSASLMPPPASSPSHISSGTIPLPPIDTPPSFSDKKKQG